MLKHALGLCIPTYNGGEILRSSLNALTSAEDLFHRRIVIDSSSKDESASISREFGFDVKIIPSSSFDHGGTRQEAVKMFSDCDIIIFMTQDAVLVNRQSILNLVDSFQDPDVVIAYGRQLPRIGAGAIEAHARIFSYPPESRIKSKELIPTIGLRTAIVSNSFAAYRRDVLLKVGGFPKETLFAEDTLTGAKVILEGYKIAYVGGATVYHSHDYSMFEEFRRYFDNGAFYSREKWIEKSFGRAEGSGRAFVLSEIRYLWKEDRLAIFCAVLKTITKYFGYKLGALERFIPSSIKMHLSTNKAFWSRS